MSAHIEWAGASGITVAAIEPGVEIGEDVTDDHALLIGNGDSAFVIEGTPDELRSFAATVAAIAATLP